MIFTLIGTRKKHTKEKDKRNEATIKDRTSLTQGASRSDAPVGRRVSVQTPSRG